MTSRFAPRRRYETLGDGGPPDNPFNPIANLTTPVTAAPLSAQLRWGVLITLLLLIIGAVVTFGVLQVRDNKRQDRLEDEIIDTSDLIEALSHLVGNLTAPPNCTIVGNDTITSNFSDALFRVFDDMDMSARFAFNLTGLDPSSLVTLTVQNASGTVAYLSDIPAVNSTFVDDVFTVQNAIDLTKQVMLDVSGVSALTTQLMTIQDASGTIAYLSDITAQPSIFLDDVFAVLSAGDITKEAMLDCSGISTGTTRIMTVQDASGVIAYLENITVGPPPYSDAIFGVFDVGDSSKLATLNCSLISTATTITMTVQDDDGTIAYLSDVIQVVEVFLNTSRVFPDVSNEGVANLTGLGDLAWIELTFCGAGGQGGTDNDESSGRAGGTGASIENFRIFDPTIKFDQFNCTVGAGGTAGGTMGADGTETTMEGLSSTGYFFNLVAYGGGGGDGGSFLPKFKGGGGGGGGNADGLFGGSAGIEGGLRGASDFNGTSDAGAINYPWRAGSSGGPTNGAYDEGSLFGPNGDDNFNPVASPCAAGGSAIPGMDGGDGACQFRYYIL